MIPPDHRALAITQDRGVEADEITAAIVTERDQVGRQPRVGFLSRVEVDADDVPSGRLRRPDTVDIQRTVLDIAELELEPPVAVGEPTPQRLLGRSELLGCRRQGDDVRVFPKAPRDFTIPRGWSAHVASLGRIDRALRESS